MDSLKGVGLIYEVYFTLYLNGSGFLTSPRVTCAGFFWQDLGTSIYNKHAACSELTAVETRE